MEEETLKTRAEVLASLTDEQKERFVPMLRRVTPAEEAAFDDWLAMPENRKKWDKAIEDPRQKLDRA